MEYCLIFFKRFFFILFLSSFLVSFFLSWFTPSCYSRTILQKGLFFRLDLWKFGSNSGNLLDGKSESAALGVWVSIELSIFIDFWHWNGKYFSGYFPFISLVEKKHENIGFIAFPVLSNFCLPT